MGAQGGRTKVSVTEELYSYHDIVWAYYTSVPQRRGLEKARKAALLPRLLAADADDNESTN